jgi:hypothetical protein
MIEQHRQLAATGGSTNELIRNVREIQVEFLIFISSTISGHSLADGGEDGFRGQNSFQAHGMAGRSREARIDGQRSSNVSSRRVGAKGASLLNLRQVQDNSPGWFVQTLIITNVHTAIYDDIEAEEADGEEVETEDEEGEEAEVEAVAAAAAAAAATDFFRFLISFSSSMSCASMISNSSWMVGSSRI